MKRLLLIAMLAMGLAYSLAARAQCTMDGRTYQTGDRVGPFTCTADGSWKR